jgi:hypothetical protein
MRGAAIAAMTLVVAPAHGLARGVNPDPRIPWSAPALIARIAAVQSADLHTDRLVASPARTPTIRAMQIGGSVSPLVAALPIEIWRGRIIRFGSGDGTGLSGVATRAKSLGVRSLQSERHVSGFLASELHYGLQLDSDDLLTLDAVGTTERLPASAAIGRGNAIHVGILYLGASLVRAHRLSLAGGWYRVTTSHLDPLDRLIERAAGMPSADRGLRLAVEWQLDRSAEPARNRIGLELRDGNAPALSLDPAPYHDRRALIRFTTAF